jgi:hypothetical protein
MRLPLFIIKTAGTKSWFVPRALNYLSGPPWPKTIVEPFGGSGIVGLSLLNEGCGERLVLAEKDKDYLAFWRAALGDPNFSYRVSKWTECVLGLRPGWDCRVRTVRPCRPCCRKNSRSLPDKLKIEPNPVFCPLS